MLRPWIKELCPPRRDPAHPSVFSPDLAPGIDEIYEESQQVFLAPGHPQDGQIVFYKVSGASFPHGAHPSHPGP